MLCVSLELILCPPFLFDSWKVKQLMTKNKYFLMSNRFGVITLCLFDTMSGYFLLITY